MQTFFVPLHELCRKFDAYAHVRIPFSTVPQLELNHTVLVRSVDKLARAMLAGKPGRDPWAARNAFKIPDEWVSTMLHELHSGGVIPMVPLVSVAVDT